jgi:hypothetical protein
VKLERALPRTRSASADLVARRLFVLPGIVLAVAVAVATVIMGVHA